MISTKKLIKMAKKWRMLAMIRQRKRISFPIVNGNHQEAANDVGSCSASASASASAVVDKGHFVVYAADERRFVIPLPYLNSDLFRKLLEISEEEFGLPSDGPIVLPFDAVFVEYIISFIRRHGVASSDLQKALLTASCCSFSSLHHGWKTHNQHLINVY